VREAARVRIEGSRDGLERIGLELGIGRWTLVRWTRQFGWRRPAGPGKTGPDFFRARRFGRPYGGDAVGVARDLVTGSTLPLRRIAAQAGVSQSTVSEWMTARGWKRPAEVARGRRLGRRRYGPEVVAAAGELYRTTELPTILIAARVGATRERVATWARAGGWTRPRALPFPDGRVRRRRARRSG
jgi:hypothetical protein